MYVERRILVLALLCGCLLSLPARGENIQQETSVLEELKLDKASGLAYAVLRGSSDSRDCGEETGLMHLSLASTSGQVLYSLLLSAHLGERMVTIWFDQDANCEITQAQLVD